MTHAIRRLGPDDQAALRALRLRALAGEPGAFGSTLERELAFADDVWRDRLQPEGAPHFGGFDAAGALVGLAVAGVDPDGGAVGMLLAMWVDPEARGGGLAAGLVDAVVGWHRARGRGAVRLWVVEGNDRAVRCYDRAGFSPTGRRDVRERDGAVEIEMELDVGARPTVS